MPLSLSVVAAGFLLYSGAWESINSVQQNAPGRSTVVNISHHHHFPKQQLQRRKPTSSCFAATKKTDIRGAIVVKSFTSSQENDVENYKSACHSLYMKLLITKNINFKVSHTVIKNCLEKSLTFLSSVFIFGVKIQTLAITKFLSFYFIKLKI